MHDADAATLPGEGLDLTKMPGHWLLARMGKRVLRPGGIELTRRMLDALDVSPGDEVVELAPGLGVTARLTLARGPARYTAVERDAAAASQVRRYLTRDVDRCIVGTAARTGLADASASVIYGEAMLTMHTAAQKAQIVGEAFRVLRPGGRYGIHELGLRPDELDEAAKARVARDLSGAIRVGARPLTRTEWRDVLERAGFEVVTEAVNDMHLLEPARIIADEGVAGAARIAFNVMTTPAARRRVLDIRGAFHTHAPHLYAVTLVARKPSAGAAG